MPMLTFLLGLALGFTLAKMPAEFWAQLRGDIAAGAAKVWAWLTNKFKRQQGS